MVKADTPSSNWSSSKPVTLSCDVRAGRWQEQIRDSLCGHRHARSRADGNAASGGCLICWRRASDHDASGGDTWRGPQAAFPRRPSLRYPAPGAACARVRCSRTALRSISAAALRTLHSVVTVEHTLHLARVYALAGIAHGQFDACRLSSHSRALPVTSDSDLF